MDSLNLGNSHETVGMTGNYVEKVFFLLSGSTYKQSTTVSLAKNITKANVEQGIK